MCVIKESCISLVVNGWLSCLPSLLLHLVMSLHLFIVFIHCSADFDFLLIAYSNTEVNSEDSSLIEFRLQVHCMHILHNTVLFT